MQLQRQDLMQLAPRVEELQTPPIPRWVLAVALRTLVDVVEATPKGVSGHALHLST